MSFPVQALWMLAAALVFSLMGVCVKFAGEHYSTMELVAYRGLISSMLVWWWAKAAGVSLRTERFSMHLWRGVVGAIALSSWFYSLQYLPLATAMTLNYMSSVWVAAFILGGALLYGQATGTSHGWLFVTILTGFGGVIMVLRPALEANQLLPGLLGMFSGVCAALAYMQVTALSRSGEPELRVVFYFGLFVMGFGFVGSLFSGFSSWSLTHALWIIPLALFAALGQFLMTRAYASGATMLVANLQYSGVIFSALLGMLVFADRIPLLAWAGMVLIVASGIAATLLRSRSLPATMKTPPEEL